MLANRVDPMESVRLGCGRSDLLQVRKTRSKMTTATSFSLQNDTVLVVRDPLARSLPIGKTRSRTCT